jgi:CBS domain-containing protein
VKVKDIMSTPVVDAHLSTPTQALAELLQRHKISAVPITDDQGNVVGLVSEHDLLAKQGEKAQDIMSRGVISVTEDTDVDDVRALIVDRRIRRVPVISGHQVIGIISRSDLVGLRVLEWACGVCGESVRGSELPDHCPKCGESRDVFVQQEKSPGD